MTAATIELAPRTGSNIKHDEEWQTSLLSNGGTTHTNGGSTSATSNGDVGNKATGNYSDANGTSDLSSMSQPHSKKQATPTPTSYYSLLRHNRAFRLYFYSYVTYHIGEWLTYLASIAAIEQIQFDQGETKPSKSMISALVIVRLLPTVVLSPFGGVLADGRDRRIVMIALDMAGALVSLVFIVAVEFNSITMIYVATFLQESLCGLYEPSRSAIIPLLVPDEENMKRATTLTGLAWSVVAALGSASGGVLVSLLGQRACYLIDSFTYLVSAWFMFRVGGKWSVAAKVDNEQKSTSSQMRGMLLGGVNYLRASFFGPLVFIKASVAVVHGGFDVLNVSFSERGNVKARVRSTRLGILFGAVGLGCWLGPLIFDRFTNMQQPASLQRAVLWSIGLMSIGSFFMGAFDSFSSACFFNAIRSMGFSAAWINSSLLLQKFTTPEMLGRVSSIDYSLGLLTEALSATIAGKLLDDYGMTPEEVSIALGAIGTVLLLIWTSYHLAGGGAAGYSKGASSSYSSSGFAPHQDVELMLPLSNVNNHTNGTMMNGSNMTSPSYRASSFSTPELEPMVMLRSASPDETDREN